MRNFGVSDLPLPENPNKTKKNKSKRKEILRSSRPGSEGPNGLVQKRKTTGDEDFGLPA
jgi:hypothetical protein